VFPGSTAPRPGSNTSAYFAARGVRLSPDEARDLVGVFLHLADLGAISAAPADECRGSSPKTPASAGVSCADRGAGVGCGGCEPGALEGPTAYNMGPSEYIGDTE
jgi:hypothetical protein